ncbi:MAG: hypothetical protein ACOCV4_02865 [Myxococcota bacterium]
MRDGRAARRAHYVVGPAYDWLLFLSPPVLALLTGMAISGTTFSEGILVVGDLETTAAAVVIGTIIHAHLVAVFFRSHANGNIFRLYPMRFVAVPIVLWLAITWSEWIAVIASVVATFWDVWHSGAQTFGFARIYDRNAGAPADQGRRLDYWLNQLLYAGPILAGATMIDHFEAFEEFDDVGATFFTHIPAQMQSHQGYVAWLVIAGGSVFLAYYVLSYWRLARQGYRVSPLKIYLLVSTGVCSIYTWGFNTWGEAFFIMNLFHAVQYLGLVWAVEHRRIMDRLRLAGRRRGKPLAATAFLGSVTAYGVTVTVVDPAIHAFWAFTLVVSLMHFWYDAFVWSVRKRQV